ncbi:MAG TPA: methionyl-tRNA formyltransferase [Bacteroidales bacterium]|nr:methionyl-tRNA formyltransferase [Bacteroidales bacterium]
MKSLRIVFMGTPEFAVASLGALIMNGFNVVGVVTSPDKPAGRGRKLTKSAVKEFAEFSLLPIMQPTNLKDPQFVEKLKKLNPDVFVVVAFRMLPEIIWKIPSSGTINLHASLLPHYRGAAPINHALINGETMTGLTTFLIDDKIDTGNILLREEIPIFPFENAGDLHDRMMKEGARLIIRTLSDISLDSIKPRSQYEFIKPGEILKTAPKITPEFCLINWDNDAMSIHNFVRGLSPYPCAKATFSQQTESLDFKIFECKPEISNHNFKPGKYFSDGKYFLKVSCRNGYINICSLKPEGRKKMTSAEFLRGFRIEKFATMI